MRQLLQFSLAIFVFGSILGRAEDQELLSFIGLTRLGAALAVPSCPNQADEGNRNDGSRMGTESC